jgi:hypothetical protein
MFLEVFFTGRLATSEERLRGNKYPSPQKVAISVLVM